MAKLLALVTYLLLLVLYAEGSHRCTFGVRKPPVFGLRAGAFDKSSAIAETDYDRAEEAIFHKMEAVEDKIQKAVEEEVHSMFGAGDKSKAITVHAKKERRQPRSRNHNYDDIDENLILHAIEDAEKSTVQAIEAAEKATLAAIQSDVQRRQEVTEHTNQALTESVEKVKAVVHDYIEKRQTHFWPKDSLEQHEDRALLHAIEAVEKAVLHGVQEEVNNLFHDTHDVNGQPKNAAK